MKKRARAIVIERDEVLHETAYTRLIVRHYTDTAGTPRVWEMVALNTRGPASVIAAVTMDNQLILERTYRIPLRCDVLELPGGCDDIGGETGAQIAARELREETGYEVGHIEFLTHIATDPGCTDSSANLFLGLDAEKKANVTLGPAEVITTVLVPLDALFDYLAHSDIPVDPKVWVAYAFLKERSLIT